MTALQDDLRDPGSSARDREAAELLPLTYKSALTMLTDAKACVWNIQIHYEQCNRCLLLYRCEHRDRKVCKCGLPRCPANVRTFIYLPFIYFIRSIFRDKLLAYEAGAWFDRRSTDPDIFNDILDVWDAFGYDPTKDTDENNDVRFLLCQWIQDPFAPFADDAGYSCAPMLLFILNFAPWFRHHLGLAHLLGIGPGVRNSERFGPLPPGAIKTHRYKFQVFVDEMLYLDKHGVHVWDANKRDTFFCRARVMSIVSDFRGVEEMIGITGTPSLFMVLVDRISCRG